MDLCSNLVAVKSGNREDLLQSLKYISNFDCDFNGENGLEYVCDEAINLGFESNQDYYLDTVKEIQDDEACVKAYIDYWMNTDVNYYLKSSYDVLKNKDGHVTAIAFACITRD